MYSKEHLISLYFSSPENPQLEKVKFSHPLVATTLLCCRGKTSGVYKNAGSFQWSPAVRALANLLLRTASWLLAPVGEQPVLAGEAKSPAASLDYAIGKQPAWLQDMFGVDSKGRGIVRRMVKRTNPERRRPGPVVLSLNEHFLETCKISIFLEGQELWQGELLKKMAAKILGERSVISHISKQRPGEGTGDLKDLFLKRCFRQELSTQLLTTNIFSKKKRAILLQQIYDNQMIKKYCGPNPSLVNSIDMLLETSDLLGGSASEDLLKEHLVKSDELSVSMVSMQLGTLALFEYAKQVMKVPLKINYRHSHSAEIIRKVLHNSLNDDAFVITHVGAAYLLGCGHSIEYTPLMLMPGISHSVVGSETQTNLTKGKYHFMFEIPSLASFYFEELKNKSAFGGKQVWLEETEPIDAADLLKEGDPDQMAVLPFPHAQLNMAFNNCRLLDSLATHQIANVGVLFVHRSLLEKQQKLRMLDVVLRDAWLTLREGGTAFEDICSKLSYDQDYLRFLHRTSGVFRDQSIEPPIVSKSLAPIQ